MKYLFILFFMAVVYNISNAQNQTRIYGLVIDETNEHALPFATVCNTEKSYYSIADSTGKFQLNVHEPLNDFYLIINSIGYESDTVIFDTSSKEIFKLIALKPHPELLSTVSIEAMTAKSIVRKAIALIAQNYYSNSYRFDATYLQYHFEKTIGPDEQKPVRLIFADVSILQLANTESSQKIGKQKVKVNTVLRSDVIEQNKETHGDHLMDLLEANPVFKTKGTVLNAKALNYFSFYYDTEFEDQYNNYKIHYQSLQFDQPKIQSGYLIIDKFSFAITSYYNEQYDNSPVSGTKLYNSNAPYNWIFNYSNLLITYEKNNEKYSIKNCYSKCQHTLIDNKIHAPALIVTENFELYAKAHHQNTINDTIQLKKYAEFSNLYSCKTNFDQNLYQLFLESNFHYLKKNQCQHFIKDLEITLPLQIQFIKNCR